MREGGADEDRVEGALGRHVVDVATLAGDEAGIFAALDCGAEYRALHVRC